MKTELEIRTEKIIENIDQRIVSLKERMDQTSGDFISYFLTSIKRLEHEKTELLKDLSK